MPVGWWFELLHLQLAHFVQYIALFVIAFPVLFIAGGGLGGDLAPFLGGLHWQSFAYSLGEQFLGLGMIVALLVWFRDRFNRQGRLARAMSRAAYAVYILHTPLIIFVAWALRSIQLDLALKFVLVARVAVALCFVVGHYARKLPLARNVL